MDSQYDTKALRPIERRVLDMQEEGVPVDEIAARFNKSPDFVERLLGWTDIPRNGNGNDRDLSPIERRVLDMRAEGASHAEIAEKFKKTERFIRQVDGLAHFKESLRLLDADRS
jgi:DNA-binding NarL/FixJ family response regulator